MIAALSSGLNLDLLCGAEVDGAYCCCTGFSSSGTLGSFSRFSLVPG